MQKQTIRQRVKEFIKNNQKYITFFIKFLLAGGLLYFLLVKLDYNEIIKLFLNVDLFYMAYAAILLFVNLGLRYTKWYLFSTRFFPEIKTKEVLSSFFYGIVGYLSIPLSVGEFVGRTTVLKKYGGIKVVVATAVDNYISLFVLIFFGFFSWVFFLYYFHIIDSTIYILTTSLFMIFVILLIWAWLKKRSVMKYVNEKFGEKKLLVKMKLYFGALYELDNTILIKILIVSIFNTFTFITQYVLLMLAFGAELSIMKIYWISLLVMFCKAMIPPITFGELGIREGVAVYFAKSFTMPASIGFNAAFSIFILNIIIPAVLGLFFVLRKSK